MQRLDYANEETSFQTDTALQNIIHNFSLDLIAEIQSNPNATAFKNAAPGAILQPIYYTFHNLRPFDVPVWVIEPFCTLPFCTKNIRLL